MKIVFHSTSKALSSEWLRKQKYTWGNYQTYYVHRLHKYLQNPTKPTRNSGTYFGSIKHIHDINMKISLKPKNIVVSSVEDLKHKAEHKWLWLLRNESNVDLLLRQAYINILKRGVQRNKETTWELLCMAFKVARRPKASYPCSDV